MATTIQLPPQKLDTLIRTAIREELHEILDDPDFGLSLKASVGQRLLRSQRAKRAGKVHTAQEIIARLGLRV